MNKFTMCHDSVKAIFACFYMIILRSNKYITYLEIFALFGLTLVAMLLCYAMLCCRPVAGNIVGALYHKL